MVFLIRARQLSFLAAFLVVILNMAVQATAFEALSFEGNNPSVNLSVLGTWRSGIISSNTPEGPVYDPRTKRVFVGSEDRFGIDVLDFSDPTSPNKINLINLGGDSSGIAISPEGILAVSRSSQIRFFNVDGDEVVSPVAVSGSGDLRFTPDGQRLVMSGKVNGESAVNVLDISSPDWDACRQGPSGCSINTTNSVANFNFFNSQRQTLLDAGFRLPQPSLSVAADIDIQGMTISADSQKAWLTLGDNNGLVEIDLPTKQFGSFFGLGTKDNSLSNVFPDTANSLPTSLPGGGIRSNGLDASRLDGGVNIRTWPIKSFYLPDNIGTYVSGGQTYLVTSNEGDSDDEIRLSSLTLDDSNPAKVFQGNSMLGDLRVSGVDGDTDGDGFFKETFGLGGRSFSIWTTDGTQVFDSGDDFEQITAAALPNFFNAGSGSNTLDNRSPRKGPEPEAFDIGTIAGRTYVFVAFERISGIMVYDITDPFSPSFEQYINNRDFSKSPNSTDSVDVEPEGVLFISATDSPIPGVPMIAVSHETSDSTTFYRIDLLSVPEPSTFLLSISLFGLLASRSCRRCLG